MGKTGTGPKKMAMHPEKAITEVEVGHMRDDITQ